MQFIHALLPIIPGRVWPMLGRSGLLELGRGGGRLSSIVGSIELVSGRFDLLLACTRLFEALVDDFVSNAAQRRSGGKASARFGNEDSTGTGVPDQSKQPQILAGVVISTPDFLAIKDIFRVGSHKTRLTVILLLLLRDC